MRWCGLSGESEMDYKAKEIGLRRKMNGATCLLWGKSPWEIPRMRIPKRLQNRGIRPSILSSLLCCRRKDVSPLYCFKVMCAGHLQPRVGSASGCGGFSVVLYYGERTVHEGGQTRMAPEEFSRSLVTIHNPQRYWERWGLFHDGGRSPWEHLGNWQFT